MKITINSITNTVLRVYIRVLRIYVKAFKMYIRVSKMLKRFRIELQEIAMELSSLADLSMHAIGFSKKLIIRVALGIKNRILSIVKRIRSKRVTSEERMPDSEWENFKSDLDHQG